MRLLSVAHLRGSCREHFLFYIKKLKEAMQAGIYVSGENVLAPRSCPVQHVFGRLSFKFYCVEGWLLASAPSLLGEQVNANSYGERATT